MGVRQVTYYEEAGSALSVNFLRERGEYGQSIIQQLERSNN